MRAAALLATRSPQELRDMMQRLGADGADPTALLASMRGQGLFRRLLRQCTTALSREDMALLCANPFDDVEPQELADAALCMAMGLVARAEGDSYRVNIDMALTALPDAPLEFGFVATLLARLSAEERASVARANGIGPRPSNVDLLLDTASALRDEATLMGHVARLSADDRRIIEEAVAHGELPDDVSRIALDVEPPLVTLDPGPAGARGLVFWFEHEASDVDARPVVPIELVESLVRLMRQVPPPPEVRAAPAPRRRAAAPTTRTKALPRDLPAVEVAPSTAREPASGTGPLSGLRAAPSESGPRGALREPATGSGPLAGLRDTAPGAGLQRALREAASGSGQLSSLRDSGASSGVQRALRDTGSTTGPLSALRDPSAPATAAGLRDVPVTGPRRLGSEQPQRTPDGPNTGPRAPATPVMGMASPFAGRVATIRPASALIDLRAPRSAEAAMKDAELAPGILELAGDGWVVLRSDVDARDWAERAVMRLAL